MSQLFLVLEDESDLRGMCDYCCRRFQSDEQILLGGDLVFCNWACAESYADQACSLVSMDGLQSLRVVILRSLPVSHRRSWRERFLQDWLGITVLLLALPVAALAGPPLQPTPAEVVPPVSVKASVSYASTSGNTDTSTFDMRLEAVLRPTHRCTVTLPLSFTRTTNVVVTSRELDAAIRAEQRFSHSWSVYLQPSYYSDRFSGFLAQVPVDGGIQVHVLKREHIAITLAQGMAPTWEQHTTGLTRSFIGTSSTAKLYLERDKSTSFDSRINYTYDLSDPANWRLKWGMELQVGLVGVVSGQVAWYYSVKGKPDPDKRPFDGSLTAGISIQLPKKKSQDE